MRRFLCAATSLLAACAAVSAEKTDDDGSYRMLLSTGVGRFSGDYGQEENTTLDVLSFNARWYLKRAELAANDTRNPDWATSSYGASTTCTPAPAALRGSSACFA